ncbi:vanillate O-demethylase monooxygenase subunit [Pseudorhodobacter antarcticus]|jgi:vanillate O-demethylase monooxygenase subunit|uniref:Vanillate O-demethylase monooxygenase subunit n=1 Tax=Pseudorhodobacter antarcticus TaxID=1077947 RepID=A0A1H8EC53_9RHOB|nr:aromatic ring-hydroxylating dioxygenase subunit alpha [Pseudorhodobacter antarcticus]SEN16338.1 vanillate O-demethylase monooxygenase subunit [Pseudorhodobacter antarcticus]
MFSGEYPLNCWYVAGRAEDFDHSLRALRLFGRAIVFYRSAAGPVVALEDACPHRKLPLSMGTLVDDRVVCGYHGLTFDGSGTCVAAPTQPDAIPKRARVHSFPIVERYGFVWIWPGDAARADVDLMLDIPNFDNPNWGKTARGSLSIGCNYLWVVDNLLDPSHVAWVHLTSFAGAGTDNAPLDMFEGADRVIVSRWIYDAPASPYYQPFLAFAGNCDRKQHYECRLPAVAINGSIYTPVGTGGRDDGLPDAALRNFSYNFMTPVDAENTLYFWFQHCNAIPGRPDMAERMFAGATMAFNEDKAILEAVQRGMAIEGVPLNLGLDAGAMRFRKLVERMIAAERA